MFGQRSEEFGDYLLCSDHHERTPRSYRTHELGISRPQFCIEKFRERYVRSVVRRDSVSELPHPTDQRSVRRALERKHIEIAQSKISPLDGEISGTNETT
jgi:hypothetical protein